MELPRSLSPWAKELAIFPPDVAGTLSKLVQRLAPAIDSIDLRPRRGDGEPDGFDGLARRGIYERLLLSEWLMAEEIPEEFDRRAVEGELAFLDLARVEPASSRLSVVLFDAGPSQLGTPRIAHIAALVVLARRAERARAELKWGVLQRAKGPLQGSLTAENVLGLLAARDFREAQASDLEAWRTRLAEHRGFEELWLVGSARLERTLRPRGALQVQVGDVLDPDVRQIRVCLRQSARTVAELRLDLPEPPQCVRLLRDPFETTQARRERFPAAAETFVTTRIDLSTRKASRWLSARFTRWAPSYDGMLWFVASGAELLAVDPTAARFEALWRVGEVGEQIADLARSPTHLSLLTAIGPTECEHWMYELHALVLRSRTTMPVPDEAWGWSLSSQGIAATFTQVTGDGGTRKGEIQIRLWGNDRVVARVEVSGPVALKQPAEASPKAFAVSLLGPEGMRVLVLERETGALRAELDLAGARHASTRLEGHVLTLADDRGRILAIDLDSGETLRNLRIQAG